MRYALLARRLFVVTVVAACLAGVFFAIGAYLTYRHNSELSDFMIYTGVVTIAIAAVSAVDSLVLTVIEAILWWRQTERTQDAEDS